MGLAEKLKEKEQGKDRKLQIWRPEPGEIIEGKVRKLGSTITEWGDANFIDLETETGGVITIFANSVLNRLLTEENVKEGDCIALKFLGMKKTKSGRKTYKDYLLVKDSEPTETTEPDEPF